ncbi:MAG TPA: aminoglycoside phosphotransferase family protein [Gaiellaceae bacterium]|nr:aminoglycoside phosphotransferase family protein [Gaiellaceae bacterium]
MLEVPDVVREKALAAGAGDWLDALPELVRALEADWQLVVGRAFPFSTEAFVAEVVCGDGTPAVLKLIVPRAGGAAEREIAVLRLTNGEGCVRLLRDDPGRGALLLERLGRPLHELGLPARARHELLLAAARRVWRPARDSGLPTGAEKARWLAEFVERMWEETGRPCSRLVVDHALACAARRGKAYREETALLAHGDVHQWNALEAGGGEFRLVDPDGLLVEPEYDLGILMREDPLDGDLRERAAWLARRTGLDEAAIWEWGVVERVSTGLLGTRVDLQPVARQMLYAAEGLASAD